MVAAGVEVEGAVRRLHHAALVGALVDDAADAPALPAVVGEDHVRVVGISPGVVVQTHDVVAGNHQPAAAQLDPVAGAGGVPGPLRRLHLRRDLPGLGPGATLVVGVGDPHRARRPALDDHALRAVGQVLAERQPHPAAGGVDHGTGVAAGHARLGDHHLERAPGAAAVSAAAQEQVDLSAVRPAVAAALAEGQDRAPGSHRQGGDAVGVAAALAADEELLLLQGGDLHGSGAASAAVLSTCAGSMTNWA